MRRLLALLLLLVLTLPASGRAAPDATLADETLATGWRSYLLDLDGRETTLDVTALSCAAPCGVGLYLYDGARYLRYGLTLTLLGPTIGVAAQVGERDSGIRVDTREPAEPGPGGPSLGMTLNAPGSSSSFVGRWYVLAWTAGGIGSSRVRVQSGSGSSVVASDGGAETFLLTSADFAGGVTANAGGTVPPFATSARASVLTSAPVEIENTFIGLFNVGFSNPLPGPAGAPLGLHRMSVATPDETLECPCILGSFRTEPLGRDHGSGTFTFHLSGAGVVGGAGEAYVMGSDARLPSLS